MLAFLDYHAPDLDLFGMWETFRLSPVMTAQDSQFSFSCIITGYFLHPSKSKSRDNSGCDYPYKSCLCIVCPCHPYFILQFIELFLYLFLFFFDAILHNLHIQLSTFMSMVQCN